MATVTIDGSDYDVYADTDEADDYLAADFSATLWRAETDEDNKARALVTSTRILDRMPWLGEKEDEDQALAWPRTGTGLSDVEDDEIPQDIIDASIVLAKLIHEGANVDNSPSTATNTKRIKAGSVEQEFFRPGEKPTRLPTSVWEMVRRFLGGAPGAAGSIASGVWCPDGIGNYDLSGPY